MTLTFPQALLRLAPASGPLAGREEELGTLRWAWSRAVAGHGGVVLVGGEAGVGKTRLVTELACDAEGAGACVLVGRCPAGGADPYHPLVEALGPVLPPAGSLDRDAMFEAMADGLAQRSRQSPVLLLLDDLHAAGQSTVRALAAVAGSASGTALLLVGTYRDAAVDRSSPLAELLERPGVEHVTLEGLAVDDLSRIHGDDDLARRLWQWSGGNPVVASELLGLRCLDDAPPAGFDDLVARRLDRLDAPARRLLDAAAVAGTEFAVPVVATAAGLSTARASAALDRLAAAGFVVGEPAAPPTRRFVHDMVREAVERGIDPSARLRLHRRVAVALEGQDGVAPAEVAWHVRAAAPVGGSAAVRRHSSRAGDRAMELLAWEEAAVHYGHALAAARGASAATRADLLLSLAEAQRLAGDPARARQAILEAASVARRCHDGGRLAGAALALGQVAAVWGADPVMESLATEARAVLGREQGRGDSRGRPPLSSLATVEFFASDELYDVLDGAAAPPGAARPAAPTEAPAVARTVARRRDPGAAAALLRARHGALAGPEHAPERLAAADDMVALALERGDDELVAGARGRRLVDLLELGRLDEARVEQSAHAAAAARLARPGPWRDAATWSAMRALIDGRPADARTAAAEALALAADPGDAEAAASFLVQQWETALEWGSDDELVAAADECAAAGGAGAGGGPQMWRAMAAVALARGGAHERAAGELRRATAGGLGRLTRDPGRLHPLTCLAEAAWALGDETAAALVGPLLEPFADRFVVAGRGLAWRGSVARGCGLASAAVGRWDEAERHLHAAVEVHRRAGALPVLARARLEEAKVLLGRGRRGDRRRATEGFGAAAELASRLGMTRLAGEAQ